MHLRNIGISAVLLVIAVLFNFGAVCAQQTASADLAGETSDTARDPIKKTNERSSDHGFSTADFLPPNERKNLPAEVDTKVQTKVVINVPRNIDARNEFTFYPYPMMPPPAKQQHKALPETAKNGLKQMLLTSGYIQRTQATSAYPFNGWRWQYAFKAALRRSNLGVPHIMTEMYSWADEMIPYIKPEIVRLNLAEKERTQRYQRAREEYDETRVDIEAESVRKGLFPVEVRIQKFDGRTTRFGTARLAPGSWWLVGTHKVAGLTYYWNEPVEIHENQPKSVELTEASALLIEGGW